MTSWLIGRSLAPQMAEMGRQARQGADKKQAALFSHRGATDREARSLDRTPPAEQLAQLERRIADLEKRVFELEQTSSDSTSTP